MIPNDLGKRNQMNEKTAILLLDRLYKTPLVRLTDSPGHAFLQTAIVIQKKLPLAVDS